MGVQPRQHLGVVPELQKSWYDCGVQAPETQVDCVQVIIFSQSGTQLPL